MSGSNFDWTRIKGIHYHFKRHSMSKYNDCHTYLTEALSSEIKMPDAVFIEQPITSENATIAPAFLPIIRNAIVEDVLLLLDEAPEHFENDPMHINDLFRNCSLHFQDDGDRFRRIRTEANLEKAATLADNDDEEYVDVYVNIDHWHFDRKKWTPMNFQYVTLTEPQTGTQQGNNNPGNVPDPAMEYMTKLSENMDRIAAKLSQTNVRPATTQNQGVQNPIGTTNTGNPAFYNIANLPHDVRNRYDKKDQGRILTRSEMGPLEVPDPTPNNPNGTKLMNYFVDGPRLVTRDGTLFDLTTVDPSKTATRDKNFLATFPKLYGEAPHQVRKWYQEVQDHCTRLNVYLHPYYLFRKEATHPRGFTVGDDDDDDLPSKFQYIIPPWSVLLFTAIRSEKVIPESCERMRQTMLNYSNGKGYETLYALINRTHPNSMRHPHDLISQHPRQKEKEYLETYYFRYIDFLQLRAFLSDQPGSLDNKHEVSSFIQGTIEKDALRRKTDDERESNAADKQAKYKSGSLLRTLQMYMDEIAKERGGARRHAQQEQQRAHRRLGKARSSSSSRSTHHTDTSTLTSKSLKLVDCIAMPSIDPDDTQSSNWHHPYVAAIHAISAKPRRFDTERPCAVCKNTGHAFDTCPVLNDIPSLKEHRIAVALFMKKIQESTDKLLSETASISKLESEPSATSVSWQDVIEPEDDESSDSDTEDFPQG